MKPEYDFTKGERGKFYRPEAEMRLPIYLDADVQDYLAQRAAEKGMPLANGERIVEAGDPNHRIGQVGAAADPTPSQARWK